MTAPLDRKLFTVDEYYKMAETGILDSDQRVELLNGEIIKMSPQKSTHAAIIDYLFEEFLYVLKGMAQCRCQGPIRINNLSEPEPDLSIFKKRKTGYHDRHPLPEDIFLVIEVADSTLAKDRTVKKGMYAQASIPEYWIVNIPEQQIEVFKSPKDGDYQESNIYKKGTVTFDHFAKAKVVIQLKEMF